MATYFISDLHLQASRPDIEQAFYDFTEKFLFANDTLYILGDFFDAWIGDDEDETFYLEIKNHLKRLSQSHIQIFFMQGNRDFLIKNQFAQDTGITLIEDPTSIKLYGTPTLLMHGDTLCTDDIEYMQFRQQVRSDAWQQQVLSLPLIQRRNMAAQLRTKSKSLNAIKASDIMDVAEPTVQNTFKKSGVTRIIHGHTHRPNRHRISIGNAEKKKACERVVLGDWDQQGWYIKSTQIGLELVSFDIVSTDTLN